MQNNMISLTRPKALLASAFRLVRFASFFGVMKLSSFFAMLILASLVGDSSVFGTIEFALTGGGFFAILLHAGLTGAYPYFVIQRGELAYRNSYFLHLLVVGIVVLLAQVAIVGFEMDWSWKWHLSLLLGALFCTQFMLSVSCKSHQRIYAAAAIEGGLFILINGYNFWLWQWGSGFDYAQLVLILNAYLIVMLILVATQINWQQLEGRRYFSLLRFGFPIALTTFLSLGLTASGRLWIDYFLGTEVVAWYSWWFRLTILSVLFFQIVNTAFFKKIYQTAVTQLDNWFSLFLLGLTVLNIVLLSCFSTFGKTHLLLSELPWQGQQLLIINLQFQMLFWIGTALYENIIQREQLANAFVKRLFMLVVLFPLLLFTLQSTTLLSLNSLCLVNAALLFLATEIQFRLLAKKQAVFTKTQGMTRALIGVQVFINIMM
ncbi:MAG: hypothetical protein AB8G22_17915 [Saprospiraceae bacterium]